MKLIVPQVADVRGAHRGKLIGLGGNTEQLRLFLGCRDGCPGAQYLFTNPHDVAHIHAHIARWGPIAFPLVYGVAYAEAQRAMRIMAGR